MTNVKRLKIILSIIIVIFSLILSFNVYYNYQKQYRIIINTYLELQKTIIEEAARVSSLWFHKRIKEPGTTVDQIEQEILTNFIEPIHLLQSGDAWIYHKNYVIFDKSSDFPDKYRGKSIRQIFDMQKNKGAYHYEELIAGVENATEGKGWYVWLPEKGKEWVAWTSFRFLDQTWTLGLSTPEKEILNYTTIHLLLFRQIVYSIVIILMLTGISVFIFIYQKKQQKLITRINEANRALKNIDTMKNDFIANISHDFRIPLTIIFNLVELNLTEKPELMPDIKEDLEIIYKTSFKFLSKINTLLDLTKLETTGLKLKIGKVNLHDFFSMIGDYYKSLLKHTSITVHLQLPDNKYDYFYTDVDKLEDIIHNLMLNAVKYINPDDGKITIDLKETSSSAQIKIIDNGIGIDKRHLDVLFSRFRHADRSYGMEYKSSGMGLTYSKQLVELLGGTIEAESAGRNKGSVFTVTLSKNKFSTEDQVPGDEIKEYIPKRMILDVDMQHQTRMTAQIADTNRQNEFDPYKGIILVVDDEYIIREIIIRYLKGFGFQNFITAYNGETALQMIYKYHPDLVITDYQMPEMNGDEFHEKVCSDPEFEFIPFIFISAIADEKIILEQKNRGAVDYLLKPIKRDELLTSVGTNMKKYMEFVKVTAIDELTGLFNRRVFFKYFESILFNPGISDLSLIMLDLDYFKKINDTYGHQAGDHVLSHVGSAILNIIRSHDIAGRYGGEEFAIILPETNNENALKVAEKVRMNIENLDLYYQGNKIPVTLSAGIASLKQCREISKDQDAKINHMVEITGMADTALYHAKSAKCSSCGFSDNAKTVIEADRCPECGAEMIASRNRVEIYNTEMKSFDNIK